MGFVELAVIRVLLVDDHPLVREGLRSLLDGQTGIDVVGEAGDGETAFARAALLQPDVIVLDLSMPGTGGVEIAERFLHAMPKTKILILTVHEEDLFLTKLLRAGVHGYVLKRSASNNLVDAIRRVAASQTYIDPALADRLIDGFLATRQAGKGRPPEMPSPRELQVIVRIAEGFSNREIAAELGVSVRTIESYKARILEKLGLRSRVEIVRYAAAHGLLNGILS